MIVLLLLLLLTTLKLHRMIMKDGEASESRLITSHRLPHETPNRTNGGGGGSVSMMNPIRCSECCLEALRRGDSQSDIYWPVAW